MIVKDEAHVIERAFDSVKDFVDYYVICDTGSTDATKEVIKAYWKLHDLKGEIHEHEWVNFGRNRTQCFELAKGKSDYILTLDADEVIAPFSEGNADIYSKIVEIPKLSSDLVYATTVLGGSRYQRVQFFKNGLDWEWSEPVHEVCNAKEATTKAWLEDLCCFSSPQDGARSKDTEKYRKDAALFEAHLEANPEDSRSWFYLAQSYGDAGDFENAVTSVEKGLEFLFWDQEIYIALLRKARWKYALTEDLKEATSDYLQAYSYMPSRAEAVYDLLRLYSQKEEYHIAAMFGKVALQCPYPPKESLFIERDIYTWRIKDLLSVAYYYTQNEEGETLVQDLLRSGHLPDLHRTRVEANLLEFQTHHA